MHACICTWIHENVHCGCRCILYSISFAIFQNINLNLAWKATYVTDASFRRIGFIVKFLWIKYQYHPQISLWNPSLEFGGIRRRRIQEVTRVWGYRLHKWESWTQKPRELYPPWDVMKETPGSQWHLHPDLHSSLLDSGINAPLRPRLWHALLSISRG